MNKRWLGWAGMAWALGAAWGSAQIAADAPGGGGAPRHAAAPPAPPILAPAFAAPDADAAPAPAPAGGQVQFSFEQADIRLVTQIVGKITGKKFVVPEGVTGKVTILAPGAIPIEEVYPLYLNMLEASGYTVAERAGVYQVVALPAGPALPSGSGAGGGLVTKLIPLKNVGAAEVKKSFEPLIRGGKEGALEVFLPGNHLIVTDTSANGTVMGACGLWTVIATMRTPSRASRSSARRAASVSRRFTGSP